jgi:hypothetical protein
MARNDSVAWGQLSARVPKALHRELKLHCVTVGTPVMDSVVKDIEEKLDGSGGRPVTRRRKKA